MSQTNLTNQSSQTSPSSARKADEIDRFIGTQVRRRRRQLGLSQQQVAERLGISYQQVQKYETGVNRLTAGRLYLLSQIFGSPIETFFFFFPPIDRMQNGGQDLPFIGDMDALGPSDVRDALIGLVEAIRDSKLLK